jgi:sugar (pentulose or hexulose) kinase
MYNSKDFDRKAALIAPHAGKSHISSGSNSTLARALRLLNLATGKSRHLLHQAGIIAAKLMGRGGHSDYNNALKTGFDLQIEDWPAWIGNVIDSTQPSGLSDYSLLQPGERFPINDPDLAPCLDSRPESDVKFLYGMLEGIAVIEATCYAETKALGGHGSGPFP